MPIFARLRNARLWSIRGRYVTALALVALLSISAFTLLSSVITTQASSGAIINVSGRQRMLSQRTTLFAQQLVMSTGEERGQVREQLRSAIDLMEHSHFGLVQGDAALNLPGNPSPEVAALYFDAPRNLDTQVKEHIARVRRLLAAPESELTPDNPDLQGILATAPGRLLESLNAAVTQYENEANAQVRWLKTVETLVFVVTLLTLLLEGIFIFRPMEREIKERNERLLHNAFHDALTGLPNRKLFTDRLSQVLAQRARNPEQQYAVLFLDFNRFKVINDSLGHNVGDALLIAFGKRLQTCVRDTDTVARLGGDEFTLLLSGVRSLKEAEIVAGRINQALLTPFEVEGHQLHVSASIGIVTSETGHLDAEDVLRDADIAMYRAKASGKVGFERFVPEMRERAQSLMSLENDLRFAIENDELRLHYQPIVSTITGQAEGFEALIRWQHPEHGMVSPAEFIPIAEDTGLITKIDRWVMAEGCRQLAQWHEAFGNPDLTLSLNLSGQQFSQADFVDFARELLDKTDVDASKINLEITESMMLTGTAQAVATLEALRKLGFKLHVDDFGTGYSSLSYLQRFPVDALKIDRSFVDQLTESEASAHLVKTIIAMAHTLHLRVVAEGVETEAQLQGLRELSCELSQGYYFSKPIPPEQVATFLQATVEPDATLVNA